MRTRATIRAEVGESFLTCESLISMDEKATPLFKEIAFSSLVQLLSGLLISILSS